MYGKKKKARRTSNCDFFFWHQHALLFPFPWQLLRLHHRHVRLSKYLGFYGEVSHMESHWQRRRRVGQQPFMDASLSHCLPLAPAPRTSVFQHSCDPSHCCCMQPVLPGNASSDWMCCLEEENGLWYVSRKEVIKEKQPTSLLNWLSVWKAAPSHPCTERWPTAGNEWNHLVLLPSVPVALRGRLTGMCLLHQHHCLSNTTKVFVNMQATWMMAPCPRSGLHVWFFFTKASFTTRLTKEPERETGSWEGKFPGSQKHIFLLIV